MCVPPNGQATFDTTFRSTSHEHYEEPKRQVTNYGAIK